MLSGLNLGALTKRFSDCSVKRGQKDIVSVLSSLGVFAPKHLHKCKNTYFILQNKYLCIYKDSFEATILRLWVEGLCRLISDHCEITVANQSILFFVD